MLALVAICLGGFFWFPGHTYLQQDSQIYLPMMEHIADPTILGKDLIATHPHLSFTLYDEIAVGWKKATGAGMQGILVAQQLVTRLLGLIGVFLLARGARISVAAGLLVTGVFALGATVLGPSVLTFEYEPTPRAFALPVILFAAGLAIEERWNAAGAAAALGLLYHAPTVAPVLGLLVLFAFWNGAREKRAFFIWLTMAAVLLAASAKLQAGVRLHQEFWAQLSPDVEQLQRMRTAYVFVGMWIGRYWQHHLLLFAVAFLAWWRIRGGLEPLTRWLLAALPVAGILSLAINFVLLDQWKWGLMPQYQPARIVLFTTLCAILSPSLAAARATALYEKILWLLIPFSIVIRTQPLEWAAATGNQAALFAALATGAAVILHWKWPPLVSVLFTAAAMWLIPNWAGVRNYPPLHKPDLTQLSDWAQHNTGADAVFHFADEGKGMAPGVFRARALRAVWVDWKGGGQVNFMEPLAREWWRRWNSGPVEANYIVHKTGGCTSPVYQNGAYCVVPSVP